MLEVIHHNRVRGVSVYALGEALGYSHPSGAIRGILSAMARNGGDPSGAVCRVDGKPDWIPLDLALKVITHAYSGTNKERVRQVLEGAS